MIESHSQLTSKELTRFSGDDVRYKSINPKVIYTLGVQHVAQAGGAYWLIDAIGSYFVCPTMREAMRQDDRVNWLQFWQLDVKDDRTAILSAKADADVEPFIVQHIEYTDFPLARADIWAGYDGQRWTLYLPSEH